MSTDEGVLQEGTLVVAGKLVALHPLERTIYIRRLAVRLQRLQDDAPLPQEDRDLLEAIGQVLLYEIGMGEIATEPL